MLYIILALIDDPRILITAIDIGQEKEIYSFGEK